MIFLGRSTKFIKGIAIYFHLSRQNTLYSLNDTRHILEEGLLSYSFHVVAQTKKKFMFDVCYEG